MKKKRRRKKITVTIMILIIKIIKYRIYNIRKNTK